MEIPVARMTSSPRPRVLLADDYADLLATFRQLLASSCEVVGSVTDGAAVCEAATRLQPDVVVLDLFIPPSNGIAVCREIKEVAPRTHVIIVSASDNSEYRQMALGAGAFAFVAKFRAASTLVQAINSAMATKSAADAGSSDANPRE